MGFLILTLGFIYNLYTFEDSEIIPDPVLCNCFNVAG